jgi:RimJ/RimL family protein N-acetyltransferase
MMASQTTDRWIETLRDGSRVSIRPIQPDDAASQAAFIDGLSMDSRHLLFLGGIAHLSGPELHRLCEPDYAQDMAYVAIPSGSDADAQQVGICRYASSNDPAQGAEIAVAVADAWQHKGLATALMRHLITYARAHDIARLYSVDAAENHQMRKLAAHFGFASQPDPDDIHQVIFSLPLAAAAPAPPSDEDRRS